MGILARVAIAAACVVVLALAFVVRGRFGRDAVFVIDHGGTYSGSWESDDADKPCVRIATAEPVVIENASLRGRGNLIVSREHQAKITIRNVRAVDVNPNVEGKSAGRFCDIERFASVTIENCSMENTGGIYLLDYEGNRTASETVRILRNRAHNINGRRSDGHGGYGSGKSLVQFAQLDKVRHAAGIEIAWNEVINDPGQSAVEDNISIYLSSGTKESPIRIHDNFIRGAYPIDPLKHDYSGGGIMLGDGVSDQGTENDSGFVIAEKNQVLDTTNYGIAISAGHDCQIVANRIVSAGMLENGKPIGAQNVGAYVWDSYKAGKTRFYRNMGRNNLIGWVNKDGRNDWWTPDDDGWENNTRWADPITRKVYDHEWDRWQDKLKAAQISIGPTSDAVTQPSR